MLFRKFWTTLLLATTILTCCSTISVAENQPRNLSLIVIGADWCPACVQLAKFVNDNNVYDLKDEIMIFDYIDIDEEKDAAKQFKVKKLPTSFLYHGKDLISKKEGFRKTEWVKWLKEQ